MFLMLLRGLAGLWRRAKQLFQPSKQASGRPKQPRQPPEKLWRRLRELLQPPKQPARRRKQFLQPSQKLSQRSKQARKPPGQFLARPKQFLQRIYNLFWGAQPSRLPLLASRRQHSFPNCIWRDAKYCTRDARAPQIKTETNQNKPMQH